MITMSAKHSSVKEFASIGVLLAPFLMLKLDQTGSKLVGKQVIQDTFFLLISEISENAMKGKNSDLYRFSEKEGWTTSNRLQALLF